ncbi:hypothetical protein BH18THE2_BH18THE2_09420 [soil metagenome]
MKKKRVRKLIFNRLESVVFEQLQSIKNSIEGAKYTPKLISEKIEWQEYCKG